ncbi:MAG TPA: aconitate hydratase, partial [Gracilimonas sp.]|nr:aconitate hydratase [Gracilimonas sp.]
ALEAKAEHGGHMVIAGENYAQGSSREHAAIAPRYLGQRAVIAKSYARIGWQNLINFGIPPFEFANDEDYEDIDQGDILRTENIRASIESGNTAKLINVTKGHEYEVKHTLSNRQREAVLDGGVINTFKKKKRA